MTKSASWFGVFAAFPDWFNKRIDKNDNDLLVSVGITLDDSG
jgi:hypothetical protein